eukprot:1158208-Pelagomonas_calceolata.AAC.53
MQRYRRPSYNAVCRSIGSGIEQTHAAREIWLSFEASGRLLCMLVGQINRVVWTCIHHVCNLLAPPSMQVEVIYCISTDAQPSHGPIMLLLSPPAFAYWVVVCDCPCLKLQTLPLSMSQV